MIKKKNEGEGLNFPVTKDPTKNSFKCAKSCAPEKSQICKQHNLVICCFGRLKKNIDNNKMKKRERQVVYVNIPGNLQIVSHPLIFLPNGRGLCQRH